jgi:hypothetical protein
MAFHNRVYSKKTFVSIASMTKSSMTTTCLPHRRESTLEKDLINGRNVENHLNENITLKHTRESSQEKSPMSVENVGSPLEHDVPLLTTRGSTLEKDLTNIANVGKL